MLGRALFLSRLRTYFLGSILSKSLTLVPTREPLNATKIQNLTLDDNASLERIQKGQNIDGCSSGTVRGLASVQHSIGTARFAGVRGPIRSPRSPLDPSNGFSLSSILPSKNSTHTHSMPAIAADEGQFSQHSHIQGSERGQSVMGSDPTTSNAEDLYLESYAFTTAAAIVGSVDRKIFVSLRDGRNVFGILRTFDQFANLVLQDTIERIYLPKKDAQSRERFAEVPIGVFMVRGENVVMLGELDIDCEDDHLFEREQVPFQEADKELKRLQQERVKEESIKAKKYLERGLVHDFVKADLY